MLQHHNNHRVYRHLLLHNDQHHQLNCNNNSNNSSNNVNLYNSWIRLGNKCNNSWLSSMRDGKQCRNVQLH